MRRHFFGGVEPRFFAKLRENFFVGEIVELEVELIVFARELEQARIVFDLVANGVIARDDFAFVIQIEFVRTEAAEDIEREFELFGHADESAALEKTFGFVEITIARHEFDVEIFQLFTATQGLLEGFGVVPAQDAILVMRDDARDWFAQERHVERIGRRQRERIDEVMAGDAAQAGEHASGEVKIFLAKNRFAGMGRMTMENAEAVFQNEPERSPAGLRYVQENHHN